MDATALTFYAVICGALGLVAPSLGRVWMRVGIGALVGIGAAALLPMLKSALGLG